MANMKPTIACILCLAGIVFGFFGALSNAYPLSHSLEDLQRRNPGLLHDIIDSVDGQVPHGSAASGAPDDKLRGLAKAFGHGFKGF